MIYLFVRDRHPHSGMKTYAAGLLDVAHGLVRVTSFADAERLAPANGDFVLFDDHVGADGLACIERWRERGGVDYGVLLHSPLLQMDLSNELADTLRLLKDRGGGNAVDVVVCADKQMARLLREAWPELHAVWLPHCLPDYMMVRTQVAPVRPPEPVLCWLPMTLPDHNPHYRHKNTYCQLAGVALASSATGVPVRIATNFASDLLSQFAAYLKAPLLEAGSIDQSEFPRFLEGVNVGLCVSLSESFFYSATDLMLRGVPILFSPALDWAWQSPELVALCGVENPGSIEKIAGRLQALITDREVYSAAAVLGRRGARSVIERNRRMALEVIAKLADPALRKQSIGK